MSHRDENFMSKTLSISEVMDMDFTVCSKSSRLLWEVSNISNSGVSIPESRLPIRKLSSDQARLVQQVLVSFGQALGPKQGAFVVDSLLSDIFEAWHREHLTVSILGQWAGSLVVATQVRYRAHDPSSCHV